MKLSFAAAMVAALGACAAAQAADHLDAPILIGNGQVDINDLYAFQSPTNPNNTVMIMTVNPFAGTMSPREFGTGVDYTFNIDNTGDAVADVRYTASFSPVVGGSQAYTLTKDTLPYAVGTTGDTTATSTSGAIVQASVYDDPFFFDLAGFQNGLMFTGDDFFAGADVSAIVLEVPSSELGTNIGIWATTSDSGGQIDRMGRPAINTVLIPSARKQEFNEAAPANDLAAFGSDVEAAITGLSDAANASALTPILLPDVLTIDTSNASGFLNGRQLADDVIDAELTLLTASSTPIGDGVDANDQPFLNVFPYLAPANVPEPAAAALLALAAAGLMRRRIR